MWPTNELGPHARLIMLARAPKRRVHPRPIRDLQSVPSAINIKTACNGEVLRKTKFNRPAATDERQIEGPYRRVRLNAWSLSSLSTPNANFRCRPTPAIEPHENRTLNAPIQRRNAVRCNRSSGALTHSPTMA